MGVNDNFVLEYMYIYAGRGHLAASRIMQDILHRKCIMAIQELHKVAAIGR